MTCREKRDSSPPRSFFYRVLRAAFPLHLLFLFLLLLPCLIPLSDSEPGCTGTNNFARSFYPMLRYTNGPPPTWWGRNWKKRDEGHFSGGERAEKHKPPFESLKHVKNLSKTKNVLYRKRRSSSKRESKVLKCCLFINVHFKRFDLWTDYIYSMNKTTHFESGKVPHMKNKFRLFRILSLIRQRSCHHPRNPSVQKESYSRWSLVVAEKMLQ